MADEFYIGWQEEAPVSYKKKKRFAFGFILLITFISAAVIAISQGPFTNAIFEFGEITEINGVLKVWPVPNIVVDEEAILLVDFGKMGANPIIEKWEADAGKALNSYSVKLAGTKIHYQGRTVFELTNGEESLLEIGEKSEIPDPAGPSKIKTLIGEIVDSKCFFGVMKPGNGKPHKSCAARCLSGGIPAVFNSPGNGKEEFYLILGRGGEQINPNLLEYTGEPVAICGITYDFWNWKLIFLDEEDPIKRLGPPGTKLPSMCIR